MMILEAYLRGLQRGIASVYQMNWRGIEDIQKDIDEDMNKLRSMNEKSTSFNKSINFRK